MTAQEGAQVRAVGQTAEQAAARLQCISGLSGNHTQQEGQVKLIIPQTGESLRGQLARARNLAINCGTPESACKTRRTSLLVKTVGRCSGLRARVIRSSSMGCCTTCR